MLGFVKSMNQRQDSDWNPVGIIPDPHGIGAVNTAAIQYNKSHLAWSSTGNLFAPAPGKQLVLYLIFLHTFLQAYMKQKKLCEIQQLYCLTAFHLLTLVKV